MAHDYEIVFRLGAFAGVLLAMLVWERRSPLRPARAPPLLRRLNNLALVAVDTLLLRLLGPIAAVGAAALADARGFGLLHGLGAPPPVAIPAGVLMLECAVYWQHRIFHAVPWLWRLHRVHHSDPDFDTTTGVRFHPLEIVLSMLLKSAVVLMAGAPVVAVVVFEVLLNVSALFNHGNVSLPAPLERVLRPILVTPDLHRVHHSVQRDETDSNFGFLLSIWDRMFGTLRAQPRGGHLGMRIGTDGFTARDSVTLPMLLIQPLRAGPDGPALPAAERH